MSARRTAFVLTVLAVLSASALPAAAASRPALPAFGQGPREVIVFTDYFCPPCQAAEGEVLEALRRIHSRGAARIVFVDVPVHRESRPLAEAFIAAASSFEEALRARGTLFRLARSAPRGLTRDACLSALRSAGLKPRPGDPAPVFREWDRLLRHFRVRSTPTVVVVDPVAGPSVSRGAGEVLAALGRL